MANTASAKKRARANIKRAARNRSARSAIKTRVNHVRRGLSEGAGDIAELVTAAISDLDRAARKGIIHRNNAARRKSRLMRRVAAAAAAGPAPEAAPARRRTRG